MTSCLVRSISLFSLSLSEHSVCSKQQEDRAVRFGLSQVINNMCTSSEDLERNYNQVSLSLSLSLSRSLSLSPLNVAMLVQEVEQLRRMASKGLAKDHAGSTDEKEAIKQVAGSSKAIKVLSLSFSLSLSLSLSLCVCVIALVSQLKCAVIVIVCAVDQGRVTEGWCSGRIGSTVHHCYDHPRPGEATTTHSRCPLSLSLAHYIVFSCS